MRKILFINLLLLTTASLFAQTTITLKNNGLISGETTNYHEIEFVSPGAAGPNQTWDFSKIQYTPKNPVSSIGGVNANLKGTEAANLMLNENGYNYFFNSSTSQLEELGYINTDKKMTQVNTDNVIKMKYPFSYGDQYTDHFTSVAFYNEDFRIDVTGDNTVSADAYGTLILPDMNIKNTLRVKTVKKAIQVNPCGPTQVSIVKYAWYATGYRYPVLTISITEHRYSNGKLEVIKVANTNTTQPFEVGSSVVMNDQVTSNTIKGSTKNDVTVTVAPNPFSEKLTYTYFLRAQVPVSIVLYDINGKNSQMLVKNQVQTEGLHTGSLDALTNTLAPGVYFIRFIFDEQVVINKVVKL